MAFDPLVPFLTADGRPVFQFSPVEDEYRSSEFFFEGVLEDGIIYGWNERGDSGSGDPNLKLVNVGAISTERSDTCIVSPALEPAPAIKSIKLSLPPISEVVGGKYNLVGYDRSHLSRAETDRLQDLVAKLTEENLSLRAREGDAKLIAENKNLREQNERLLDQLDTLIARFGLVG